MFRHACPLDAPLDTVINTDDGACFVTGTYEFEYVLFNPVTGVPTDTALSQKKSFQYPSFTLTYVADIGYVVRDGEFFTERLVYFKGSGVEYGSEPVVTSNVELPPRAGSPLVEVYPNPFVDRLQLRVRDGSACESVRVIDMLGRTVIDNPVCRGELELGAGILPGFYVVVLDLSGGVGAGGTTILVTKR